MSYRSIDLLQRELGNTVFSYAKDQKKAAGRALGTFVEIITYYLLDSWGFSRNIAIETPLKEFSNPGITHNVEFTLHPCVRSESISFKKKELPLTPKKILSKIHSIENEIPDANNLLSRSKQLKNACKIRHTDQIMSLATLTSKNRISLKVSVSDLLLFPFAMFECKRVGIEEGMRKGPQTIEKAKQGAYVARAVSALQRLRGRNGSLMGFLERDCGAPLIRGYYDLLNEMVDNPDNSSLLKNFVLTIGVISNHGNWFTQDNMNKELEVLAQSYDWLLFLSDAGLAEFIESCLLSDDHLDIKNAFASSYPKTDDNRFTKAVINMDAHFALKDYFSRNNDRILSWFNLIAPSNKTVADLQNQLTVLQEKQWETIYS